MIQPKWVDALSTHPSLETAIDEVVEQVRLEMDVPADLGFLFISSDFASDYARLMPLLQTKLSIPVVIGCSGGGIIGYRCGQNSPRTITEVEGQPALSLSLAWLPDVTVHSFHLSSEDLPDLDSAPDAWVEAIGVDPKTNPQFVLLADPLSSGINNLLSGLDFAYPQSVKVGGLAGTGISGRDRGLFCGHQLHREGIVGVALAGNIAIDTIVAQGCRPVGHPYQITKSERNIILELENCSTADTRPCSAPQVPIECLQKLFKSLDEADQRLAQESLFIGITQNEFKQTLEPGDFLIRNLLGIDPKVGAIAIGDRVRPGQRIQFHLRDAKASADDLETLLKHYQTHADSRFPPIGSLMFSCMGRGEGLYGQPNFDSSLFHRYLPQSALSGFFCNGEIGPIGGTTFLHGYTSVFGILRQAEGG